MNVIVDVASYPQWISFLKGVEILTTDALDRPLEARFVLDAGVIVDDYTLAYSWSDDEVSWHLVSGTSIKAMDGSYRLHATPMGTDVDYELSIDVSVLVAPRPEAQGGAGSDRHRPQGVEDARGSITAWV